MTNKEFFGSFDIQAQATTAPAEDKYTGKNALEKCKNAIEAYIKTHDDSAPTWEDFCAIINRFSVVPSKALYVSAFGEERTKKLWLDAEARFLGLQAVAAVYADEIGDVSAQKNQDRRQIIGTAIKRIYAYFGKKCKYTDIPKKAIATIGEYALKYCYTDWDNSQARAIGVTSFARVVFTTIEGYDTKSAALDALKNKAFRAAEKAQICADNDAHWLEKAYPGALPQKEKSALEEKSVAENS